MKHLDHKGFTLTETLAAVASAGISFVALTTLLISSMQANVRAGRITAASTLAQDKVEEMRLTSYAAAASGADSVTQMGLAYLRNWTVSSGPTDRTRALTVTVGWNGQASAQVSLQTIIGG